MKEELAEWKAFVLMTAALGTLFRFPYFGVYGAETFSLNSITRVMEPCP